MKGDAAPSSVRRWSTVVFAMPLAVPIEDTAEDTAEGAATLLDVPGLATGPVAPIVCALDIKLMAKTTKAASNCVKLPKMNGLLTFS
ncbi:MAG: hypothetical protein ORN28_05865 [Rhodoferax sp.]|nr:hypothetical protein [Rhodoferax sp.]